MLTIKVDYERINGRYTNAEYRGKITRCDLTLSIKYRAARRGGGGLGGCVRTPLAVLIISKSCRFSPETGFTPDFGLKISTPFVKPLNSHPPPPSKV